MSTSQTTIIPHSQLPLVTREYPSEAELSECIFRAYAAQKMWKKVPLRDRLAIAHKFADVFLSQISVISSELSQQIGRPITYCQGECKTMLKRTDYLLSIAQSSLEDQVIPDYDNSGSRRYIQRIPHGVILAITPWNYPYLVTINTVLPALVAGNTVLLKPSPQTPLAAESFAKCWVDAGLPQHVLQVLHLPPLLTEKAIQDSHVNFVIFTGSVLGGKAVDTAVANAKGFKGVALELGGKDPAYVRDDADIDFTVTELVDGLARISIRVKAVVPSRCLQRAFQRIYVHESKYEEFVQKFVDLAKTYKLGDPAVPETTLGPVISLSAASRIRKQIADAGQLFGSFFLVKSKHLTVVAGGARELISSDLFSVAKE
ncbi:hypothetical protein Clacol_003708 [Clathrus columnatus]|uniref:Aldehyde dehydrogenase domain-containing protein n=1 Tax=Clathrus columnatus TaxID=1419009 RepID=A0AAV5A958_9AGAM|nr:hypothetical protein Clacol_003708 [Clathrus columnatus]